MTLMPCSLTHALAYMFAERARASALFSMQVQVAVLRYPEQGTDILITMNTPSHIHDDSAAAQHAGSGQKYAHLSAPDLFHSMLKTFHVIDYSLFG